MNNKDVEVCVANDQSKKLNIFGSYPLLVTEHGAIGDAVAIAKFFATGSTFLLGANNEEQAKVDQWIYWCLTGHVMVQQTALDAVFGNRDVLQKDYNDSMNAIKANAKILNENLKEKQWLVGGNCTLADLVVACGFLAAQQTILDAGFRKAMPHYSAWFERVVSQPDFIAVAGAVKSAAKAVKPQIKAEEKKKEEPKKQAAKPKDDDGAGGAEKKEKNPLDLLPETPFDLYNFKTYFVNEKDRAGAAVDEFKKQYDPAGWSLWFLHYEKYGNEGKILYQTENLLDGFLQRFDSFRKYSFGRMCILGTEDCQDIKGVFMWRSNDITQECKDHPQFEYYQRRKLDINNADDEKLVREFWGSVDGGSATGQPILSCKWHK